MDSSTPEPAEAVDGLDDNDLEVALLTSSREAFAGFANLGALPPMPRSWQPADHAAPWRQR